MVNSSAISVRGLTDQRGFGGAAGRSHRLRFWLLSRYMTQWPVVPLLSGLLFANPARLSPASGGTARHSLGQIMNPSC